MQQYLRDISRVSATPLDVQTDREGSGDVRFVSMSLKGMHGSKVSAFRCGAVATIHFVIENRTNREVRGLRAAVLIENEMGQRVALLDTLLLGVDLGGIPPGRESLRVIVPKMPLIPGRYRMRIFSTINGIITDWIKNAAIFDVESGDYYGTGQLPPHNEGIFLLDHRFVVGERHAAELAAPHDSPTRCTDAGLAGQINSSSS